MAVAALVIYLVWFALAFGARTLIALRRTVDSGWRGVSGRPLTLEWWAGVLFVVALAVGVAAPLADLAGLQPLVASPRLGWGGVLLAATGVALTLVAQLSMGNSWRIGVDQTEHTSLITTGAFALVRNPIFTAMVITAVGLTLMVPNTVAVTGLIGLVVGLELQVCGIEEPYMERVHGDTYATYAARVGRFPPGLGRLHMSTASS